MVPWLSNLQVLNLSGCRSITDVGFNTALQHATNLTTLELRYNTKISATTFTLLSRITKLNSLDIGVSSHMILFLFYYLNIPSYRPILMQVMLRFLLVNAPI